MKDMGALMKQAQAMQQKLAQAQEQIAQTTVEGSSGGGLVKVTLKGSGELSGVEIDDSLLAPGEGEVLADLIVAAHANARRDLEAKQSELMRQAAGPLAGMNIPGLKF